jgi:hypothetical protein
MKFVAIIKVSDGKKAPAGFPLECREYASAEEASLAHPGCIVMRAAEYREHAAKWHEVYQAPKPQAPVQAVTALALRKRPWWKFWSKNG